MVLLVGVGGVVVVGGGDDDDSASDAGTDGGRELTGEGSGAPEPTGDMPVTYAEAEEAGTLDDYEWGDRCDTETGTLKMPSVYAAPCVPVFDGDNGGATTPGVTADTVRIVRYVPEQNADLTADPRRHGRERHRRGAGETLPAATSTIFTSLGETYGRTVELVDFQATGAGDDMVAAKADATRSSRSWNRSRCSAGPASTGARSRRRSRRTASSASTAPARSRPTWSDGMRPYSGAGCRAASSSCRRSTRGSTSLAGDARRHQGDLRRRPDVAGAGAQDRRDPLRPGPAAARGARGGRELDEDVADQETYVLDFALLPAKATELMAKFKNEEITTIIFLGDPIMPGYLMDAATTQEYYPEWIITGTVLTDTNVLARGWNPAQMTQAFGISQLAAPVDQRAAGRDHASTAGTSARARRRPRRTSTRCSRPRRRASSCAASTWPARS